MLHKSVIFYDFHSKTVDQQVDKNGSFYFLQLFITGKLYKIWKNYSKISYFGCDWVHTSKRPQPPPTPIQVKNTFLWAFPSIEKAF